MGFNLPSYAPTNKDYSRHTENRVETEKMVEANSKMADLFEKVYHENHQLYRTLHERYEKVQKEMEDLKVEIKILNILLITYQAFYGNEIEREKSAIHVVMEENKDLRQLVSQLMRQLKEVSSNTGNHETHHRNDKVSVSVS